MVPQCKLHRSQFKHSHEIALRVPSFVNFEYICLEAYGTELRANGVENKQWQIDDAHAAPAPGPLRLGAPKNGK